MDNSYLGKPLKFLDAEIHPHPLNLEGDFVNQNVYENRIFHQIIVPNDTKYRQTQSHTVVVSEITPLNLLETPW